MTTNTPEPVAWCYTLVVNDEAVNQQCTHVNWNPKYQPFGRAGIDHRGRVVKTPLYSESALQMIVAGAIYDFAAYLTTRKTSMPVGEKELCGPMVDAIKEWAIARNLPLNDAAVLSWQDAIDRARSRP